MELFNIVEKRTFLVLEKHSTHICAVTSDNVANIIKTDKLVSIWHLTCNSHTANLFAKDLVSKQLKWSLKVLLKTSH